MSCNIGPPQELVQTARKLHQAARSVAPAILAKGRMAHTSHEETTRETGMEARVRDADYPLSVRDAAQYLGVSPQTVYLWVERKQIPHLRVMGRNIRFLKSDLETFRASFKQEMENA